MINNTTTAPQPTEITFITHAADLDAVPYVERSVGWLSSYAAYLKRVMVQSAICHPEWDVDIAFSYLVNDEFADPSEVVSFVRMTGSTYERVWHWAKMYASTVPLPA